MIRPDPQHTSAATQSAEDQPEQAPPAAMPWFRMVMGIILLTALLTVIVRGIYVVIQVTGENGG